jgi:hypothetical protein
LAAWLSPIRVLKNYKDRALRGALLEGATWLTKIKKYQHQRPGRIAAEGLMVRAQIGVQAAAKAAVDANFSGAKRSANSAWKKLTTLITKTCACSGSL